MLILWLRACAWAILRRWPDTLADRARAAALFGVDTPPVPVLSAQTLLARTTTTWPAPVGFKATFHDTLRRNDPHAPVSRVHCTHIVKG